MSNRNRLLATALLLASAGAVSSCASKEHISLTIPPATDLKASPEPGYPDAALGTGPDADKTEQGWEDDILAWGRGEHAKVERLCQFYADMGVNLGFLCRTEPAAQAGNSK